MSSTSCKFKSTKTSPMLEFIVSDTTPRSSVVLILTSREEPTSDIFNSYDGELENSCKTVPVEFKN